MPSSRPLNKDLCGAALLVALGVGVVVAGVHYRIGTLTRMGAGFMPVVYGTLLASIGVVLGVTAGPPPDRPRLPPEWRGWVCILGGVLAFALVGKYGGLVPATFVSVFIPALGDRQNTWRSAALLAVAVTIASYLIFTLGLHLQLAPFTWG